MKTIQAEDNIGEINPMCYKRYYYNSETKYYWLNSLFYVPSWRRLHNEIQKYPYNTHDNLRKLVELLKEILKKWGKL